MKVIRIDPFLRLLTFADVKNLKDMQKIVGGYIQRAHIFSNGDELFVNEEGLLNAGKSGKFTLEGCPSIITGHGFIIGPTVDDGDGGVNTDVQLSIGEIGRMIRYYGR